MNSSTSYVVLVTLPPREELAPSRSGNKLPPVPVPVSHGDACLRANERPDTAFCPAIRRRQCHRSVGAIARVRLWLFQESVA